MASFFRNGYGDLCVTLEVGETAYIQYNTCDGKSATYDMRTGEVVDLNTISSACACNPPINFKTVVQ